MNRELSSAVYHDLKNRLAILCEELGRLQTLCAADAKALAHASAAEKQARALTTQLRGLLIAQRAEAGRLPVDMQAETPGELLTELADDARLLAPEHLTVQIAPSEAPPLWFVDRMLLRLALDSALYNALRFARTRVILSVDIDETGMLVFRVLDDGPGLKDGMPSLTSTGLGLHVCEAVAKAHRNKGRDGHCELRNAPSGGAVFEMHLP